MKHPRPCIAAYLIVGRSFTLVRDVLALFGASQFSNQPEHRKYEGDNPKDVKKNTGHRKGNAKDYPQKQQHYGQNEEFAHERTFVLIKRRANGKRQLMFLLYGPTWHDQPNAISGIACENAHKWCMLLY